MSHWPVSILSTLSSLVSMALPLVLVRSLDPSTLGVFKIFFLYLMVLPPLTMVAGVSSGLSYWAGRGEEGRKAIRVSGILFLVLAAISLTIFLGLNQAIAAALKIDPQWVTLFAPALSLAIAAMFYDDAAIATGHVWRGALFNAGFELVRTGSIVVTAIFSHDLIAIIKAHLVVQTLKVGTGYALAHRQSLFRWEWDTAVFRKVVQYALPVSLAFVVGLGLNYSDQMILSSLIPPAEFAMYAVCCLTVPPLLVLEASVTRVLIPQMSQAFNDNVSSRAASLFRKSVKDLSFFIFPAVTGMIVFASPIVELLFTRAYIEGAHFLQFYALWYLTLIIPQDAVARSRGEAKWILGNFICFSVLTLLLCFVFAKGFGALGALSGLLLARTLSRIYTVYWMQKRCDWKLGEFLPFQFFGRTILYCAVLGAASWLFKPLFQSQMTWFFTMGGAFTAAYFFLALRSELGARDSGDKVLMLTPGLFIGGLERMILNLSRSLKRGSKWQPQVWAYDFAPEHATVAHLIPEFQTLEIPVHSKSKPPRFSFKTVLQIAKHAAQGGVSVIHTHDLGALIYGVLAKLTLLTRVRLVHTQHSFVHLNRSWKYRYYEKFFARFADSIAVVSPDTKKSYLELGIPEHKLHLIPNGVDFPAAPELDRGTRIARRRTLGPAVPETLRDSFWILYLARIHGRKGQDHAIKLWNAMEPDTRRRACLIFVGPETEKGALAALQAQIAEASDRERIVLAGPSQTPHEWVSASDLFLSCSEFEGMPLAPIEAIGSGVPAVLSKIPGHEFLDPYCHLYSLDHPATGAAVLEHVMLETFNNDANYRQKLWQRTASLRESFTLTTMSHHYGRLYEGAL